ncbi:lupus La protein [Chiloscyllium plagiosum]|uniref:lupus La protein n=1 Tax=Chiloscyllium plagiosum TaxID=36176 RepID=UPI001CB7C183|nr:lupus La protein [Chiloscyllium plagiosum]
MSEEVAKMAENGEAQETIPLEKKTCEPMDVAKMAENGEAQETIPLEKKICEQMGIAKMAANEVAQEITPLEKKICEQIEYYFGDHNLPRDKFLKEQIKLDDGWIPLETLIKFNRLSRLTTDFTVIVEGLKKSKSGLMEISEDKTKIRRSPSKPVPEFEEYKNSVKARSVYVKGFPTSATLDEIKGWFDETGPVENIQMRRTLQRQFKGSVFVIFDSVDSATKFVETPGQKYKDNDMIVLFKESYFAKKAEERKLHKTAKNKKTEKDHAGGDAALDKKCFEEKTGCLLKFAGDLADQTCREDIHEIFSNHGEIQWIDFIRGAKEGNILFKTNAKEALEKATEAHGGKLQLRDKDVTWEIVEGEEEKTILKKILEDQRESLNKRSFKARRGRGRGGKGNSGQQRVQFQGKKTKFESEDEDGDEGVEQTTEITATSPKKRTLEETKILDEPSAKQLKTEDKVADQ